MRRASELKGILRRIDGKGYKAYSEIAGAYDFGDFRLFIDRVQSDPFAPPSRARARVDQSAAGFRRELYRTKVREVALEDFLARSFSSAARAVAKGRRGTGRSGIIEILPCSQAIIERTSLEVNDEFVEASFRVGLPARGRRILAREAAEMLLDEIPEIVRRSLFYASLPGEKLRTHVETAEDAEFIRSQLEGRGLVAFVADGAVLPRESGVSDRPMREGAVPFKSPPELEVEFDTPNHGLVKGAGIPEGVTLIVGGGYHGKSTLLNALALGVYDHIPGDGREFVVTRKDAVFIRAEDGRYVENVDISPFLANLPSGADTASFGTADASGSTSQAANIMEALEAGAKVLLIDEDTSATNFMFRDAIMQKLVGKDKEPITPLIDRVRELYDKLGVSTVIVAGGSGEYFEVADTVIMMDSYVPRDVTSEAERIISARRERRVPESGGRPLAVKHRRPIAGTIDARKRTGKVEIKPSGVSALRFGGHTIDLSCVHQLVEPAQLNFIGEALRYLSAEVFDRGVTLRGALDEVEGAVERYGLKAVLEGRLSDCAYSRRFEIAAALNRLRTLRCG